MNTNPKLNITNKIKEIKLLKKIFELLVSDYSGSGYFLLILTKLKTKKMSAFNYKSVIPHISAVVFFLLITYLYFSPVLEGKKLKQSDVLSYQGMSKEATGYQEKTGETALWTNCMFGGMPTYLIINVAKNNLFFYAHQVLTLNHAKPAGMVFLYLLGFYLALLIFGINPWLSIAGAIAYAFSSYFFIILEPGHITKAMALGYLPGIVAGTYYTFRKNLIYGGIITSCFLTLQILSNHLQITYYTFMILLVFGIFEFAETVKKKNYFNFFKAVGVLIIAGILAAGCNITNLWLTMEYGKHSMRGESELTSDKHNKTTGLDKDYATAWSYGVSETLTLLIPNAKGGASGGALSTSSESYEYFNRMYGATQAKQIVKQMPTYWGDQSFTSGPVYAGAVVFFLFVFGLIVMKGYLRWWLLSVTILSVFLAWGRNFMSLTDFFLDYVPGYNKFRTVSMILVIAEFALPLLAVITLDKILKEELDTKKILKSLKLTLGIAGGFVLLLALFSGSFFDFASTSDSQYEQAGYPMDAIRADRESMFRNDGFRTLAFFILTSALIYLAAVKKIKPAYSIIAFTLLLLTDLWTINKRYLNNDLFVSKTVQKDFFSPTSADLEILKDKDINYRVLNVAVNTFNDATTSYLHKSVGGYHGAKMKRYQELIENHISKNNMNVLNMLNMKYVIIPTKEQGPVAQQNPFALGNAWFVKSYRLVENADSELVALSDFNPGETAIADKRYAGLLKDFSFDSAAYIKLVKYSPNSLVYEASCNSEQLAVFSEIFYDKGWNAFVDNTPAGHFRVNYVLRAMFIPAGKHNIEFRFEPQSFYTGEKISLASSLILISVILGLIILKYLKKSKENTVYDNQ